MKKSIYAIVLVILLASNILTLTSAVVYDALYGLLSRLSIPELMANSPAQREAKLKKKLAKQATIIKKTKSITRKISRRMITMVSVNVASIPSEVIPILGVSTVLAVTALDIKYACDTMTDLDDLAVAIEGNDATLQSDKVCGKKIPSQQELINLVKNHYQTFNDNVGSMFNEMFNKL